MVLLPFPLLLLLCVVVSLLFWVVLFSLVSRVVLLSLLFSVGVLLFTSLGTAVLLGGVVAAVLKQANF